MAANRLEGEVEITLDKRRILKQTWRGVALFSQHTGISVDAFARMCTKDIENGNTPRTDFLAELLWCYLEHEDRMLTVERAAELIGYAEGSTWVEKQITVIRSCLEVYSLRQGFDPQKVKAEAGEANVPPSNSALNTTSASPAACGCPPNSSGA